MRSLPVSAVRAVLLCVALLLVVTSAAAAQTADGEQPLDGKFRSGDDVEIGPEQTVEGDLYVAAATVRVAGTVSGDLIVAAGTVDVVGAIGGDLIASAGTVNIDGTVGGDTRVAAAQTDVTGTVGEDLVVATGTLTIANGSRIGEDVVFTTGATVLDGTVDGAVLGGTSDYRNNGSVAGTERVTIQEAEPAPGPLDRVWSAVRRWVSLVVVGALLVLVVPAVLARTRVVARQRPLPSLGVGQLALIGVPLVVLVGLFVVAVVAAALGLGALTQLAAAVMATGLVVAAALAMVFVLLVGFVAQVIVSLIVGRIVITPRARGDQLVAIALGALVLVIVFAIPVLGGLLQYATVLLGLGALVLAIRSSNEPAASDTEPVPRDTEDAAARYRAGDE